MTDDFNLQEHREELAEDAVEAFKQYYRDPNNDAHDALSKAVFEVCDEWLAYRADPSLAMAVLDNSPNEPDEWMPHARDKTDWREVIKAMAYSVVKQDTYDALEERGYLDDHWNVTDKLTDTVDAPA